MEMGNQYGINMGNILSTASNIKTARLNRETKQRTLDKDKARERNALAKIKKGQAQYEDEADDTTIETESQNALVSKSKPMEQEDTTITDEVSPLKVESAEEDTEIVESPESPQNALTANKNVFGQDMVMPQLSEQEMLDYALDSDSYDKMIAKVETSKLVQRQYEQKLATLQMTMPDATPAQRQQLAKASVADMKVFTDMIVKADDKTREIAKEKLNMQARQLFNVSQLPQKGSARKDAYTQWRNNQIQAVPKEKQESIMNSIPEWQDGKTMGWIAMKLAEVKDTFDTVNDIEAKKKEAQAKVSAATTKHLREQPKVVTHGDKDIKLTPTKSGWKEDSKTSNALLKEQEKNKGGSGGFKTSDFSLVEKIAIRNTTGLDLDNPDDMAKFAELSQEQRNEYTDLSARASRIYKDGGGKITHAEAVKKASSEKATTKKRNSKPKEGTLYKKGNDVYKIVNGKPVKQ